MNKKNIMKRAVLGTICAGACAYAVTFGVMIGFGKAEATSIHPSSECHAATDDIGPTLQNAGGLTYTGTIVPFKIYCPAGSGVFGGASVTVYGKEGVDGSNSRNCDCTLPPSPTSCSCALGTNWVNSTSGVVASGLDTFGLPRELTFGYVLHIMSQNSTL